MDNRITATAQTERDAGKVTPAPRPPDDVSDIMAYEQGELDPDRAIALFQRLIDSGLVWQLQGSYGRTARELIDRGWCRPAPAVA